MRPIPPPIGLRGFKQVVYAKDQPEYLPLPALRSNDAQGWVITVWRLTWWERIKIFFGADLYASFLTFNRPLQPMELLVGSGDWQQQYLDEDPAQPPHEKYDEIPDSDPPKKPEVK